MAENKSTARWVTILLIVGLVAILVGVFASFRNRAAERPSDEVIATINGEPLTREAFDTAMAVPLIVSEEIGQVPPVLSEYAVLNQLIDDALILQSASEAGVTVSEDEVNREIAIFLSSIGSSRDSMEALLNERNISWEAFSINVKNTLISEKFIDEELLIIVMALDKEEFYNSWLIVRKQESEIVIEPAFLEEINRE